MRPALHLGPGSAGTFTDIDQANKPRDRGRGMLCAALVLEMEMVAQEEFEYRGQRVAIEAFGETGWWGWRFRIGDEPLVGLERSPAKDQAEALAEAASAARSVLDLRRRFSAK